MSLIAVDIGNTRIKFWLFESIAADGAPEPARTFDLATATWRPEELAAWVAANSTMNSVGPARWWIGSVHRAATTRLLDFLTTQPTGEVRLVAPEDLPLVVRVAAPAKVGIDRLAGAVAANRLRAPERPAILIGLGTAMTVDAVAADGAFLGGAIAPGIAMSARALHEFTDLLPLVEMSELDHPPSALGTATREALESGLFWGAIGAMRELSAQLSQTVGPDPEIFLTGGAAPAVAGLLGPGARHAPHLVLSGIALAAFRER